MIFYCLCSRLFKSCSVHFLNAVILDMFEGTVMIIGMIIGIEIIEGEVGVEIGTHVTDTE